MNGIARLFETVRRLRPSQLAHRVVARVDRLAGCASAPPDATWRGLAPLPVEARRDGDGADRETSAGWRFAGVEATTTRNGLVWAHPPSALARYHAAYAEPVASLAQQGRLDDARRWLAAVLVGAPSHPYVRSRRALALVDAAASGLADAVPVVASDAQAIARRPEWDVRGNHLLANGAALVRAGAAFSGGAARRWRSLGRGIVEACVREQVLADGLHYERSPVYHAIVLEHLLGVAETAAARGEPPPGGVEGAIARAAAALRALHLPDGGLVRWRDGAPGMAIDADALVAWAARRAGPIAAPRSAARVFADAGLAILESVTGDGAVTLVAAPPCPGDLPAHGHADALAYEAVLGGVRVVSTARTVDYAPGADRDRARRPGAFAGLLLDGEPHADPYGAFRVGARGWTRHLDWGDDHGWRWAASYAGFPAVRRASVRRLVSTTPSGGVVVLDEWIGRRDARIDAFAPLAPGLVAEVAGDAAAVSDRAGRTWRLTAPGATIVAQTGRDAVGLGLPVERAVLRMTWSGAIPRRCVHAWTAGSGPSSVDATPGAGGEARITLRSGASQETGYLPLGVPA